MALEAEGADAIQHATGFFDALGRSLFYQQRTAAHSGTPLILVHGGGDHSGRHFETATRLVRAGYSVHALDLPGHGRSPGKRGHIRYFDEYVASVRAFVQKVSGQHAGQKPILLGHSLGGLISTFYAIKYQETIRCLILSSPLWDFNFRVPLWKRILADCLLPVWPSLTMDRPRVGEDVLSHDPRITALYRNDPLVHAKASVRLYAELQRKFKELPLVLPQLKVPTLILQAGADRVASPKAPEQLFPSIGSTQKTLLTYDGYYHEVLHEVNKERVFQDLVMWLQTTRASRAEELPLG